MNCTRLAAGMIGSRMKELSAVPSCGTAANMPSPPTAEPSRQSNKRQKSAMEPGSTAVLPDDIILEVLPRLPVKSILRFKAVCSAWAALFSSKDFCSLHMATWKALPREPKLQLLSFRSRLGLNHTQVYSWSLPGPGYDLLFTLHRPPGNSLEVVASSTCCGLTLIADAAVRAYYVCNAATRAIIRLPSYRYHESNYSAGLGFNDQTKEYKVVTLIVGYSHEKKAVKCNVYTAGADCWRPAAREVPFELCQSAVSAITHASMNEIPPVFANGFLHWLTSPNLLGQRPEAAFILFHVAEETFGSVPSPPFWGSIEHQFPWPRARGEHLVVMDDQVCIVRDLRHGIPPISGAFEIWGLVDYGSGDWSMNHRIDMSRHIGRVLGGPDIVRVIGSVGSCRSGKKIVISSREHCVNYMLQEKVYTYDPRCQVLQHIRSAAPSFIRGSKFSLFEESLTPLHKSEKELALPSTLAKETTTPN